MSFGLISPVFQKVNITDQPLVLSTLRLVKSRSKNYNQKDLNKNNFLIRYKNFIKSPSSHFIYETALYFVFLILFSYYMLTEIVFETSNNCIQTNLTANMSFLNQSQKANQSLDKILCKEKMIKMPSYFEYILIVWVISFICQEMNQVDK